MATDLGWANCFPELEASGDPVIRKLIEQVEMVRLSPATGVFSPGAACDSYVLVVRGTIRVQLLTEGGQEVLLYRVRPGESCVLTTSCLISHERYPAAAVTETEVEAAVVGREVFDDALERSSDFRRFVFASFGRRLAQVIARMDEVAFGPIEGRLARLLDSGFPVVRTTHQQLAGELGSSREVVSRYLKRYEARGWIRLKRGAVEILDRTAIRRLASGMQSVIGSQTTNGPIEKNTPT